MHEFHIAIHSFPEVQDFIHAAMVQPFEIFVSDDNQQVNGKGYIGMVSLDFSHPLLVRCRCDNRSFNTFCQQISRLIID